MNLRRDWNNFWFGPVSSAPLGLFRLAFGSLIVASLLLLFPDRDTWYSNHGVMTTAATDAYNQAHIQAPYMNVLHGVAEPWLTLFLLVVLIAAICLALGLWTRLASIIVFIGLNGLHNRNHLINSGADAVMMVMAGYLMFAPAGVACSLDRLRRVLRGEEDEEAPLILPWAQRFIQLQVAILYLISFVNKWAGDKWRDGTAVYWSMSLPELQRFPTPLLNAHHMSVVNIVTYGTLAIELALAFLVWVPRLRLYVLAAGTLMHVGIEYSMNIPLFSFLMIATYIPFLTEADLQHFLAWVREPLALPSVPGESGVLRLVYDGACGFCRSALLVVRFLDVFRLVTYLDFHDPAALRLVPDVRAEEAELAMIVVDRNGRQFSGYYAFRALAWRLPALWLLAPFLYLPGVPWAGRRLYRWIATHRTRLPVAPRYTRAPVK
jgi:predicted DCC family thiol-disulfide oxidoreductase YuxK